ncbi:MAG: SDR family oxidoreductase [Acidimicrobiia bacterium]
MSGICDGRVVIVTGAGRGLGRSHALELARQGAKVVVNDLGVEVDGTGRATGPAGETVDEIRGFGGEAIANGDDVADWDGAGSLVQSAIDTFGRLDAVVNNAGILRDRMFVNMTADDWDAVMRVHLRGMFCPTRRAAEHWRERSKPGETVDASVVTTSSAAGLWGNVGQANYSTAKMGILGFTLTTGAELKRYGVRVNSIAPGARTRMTEQLFSGIMAKPEAGFDPMAPENVSPVVAWLASTQSAGVSGRCFEVYGGKVVIANGWTRGPEFTRDGKLDPAEVDGIVRGLLAEAPEPIKVQGT